MTKIFQNAVCSFLSSVLESAISPRSLVLFAGKCCYLGDQICVLESIVATLWLPYFKAFSEDKTRNCILFKKGKNKVEFRVIVPFQI